MLLKFALRYRDRPCLTRRTGWRASRSFPGLSPRHDRLAPLEPTISGRRSARKGSQGEDLFSKPQSSMHFTIDAERGG